MEIDEHRQTSKKIVKHVCLGCPTGIIDWTSLVVKAPDTHTMDASSKTIYTGHGADTAHPVSTNQDSKSVFLKKAGK